MGTRKNWNQMTIEIDKEGNMVNVEVLLKLFESQRDWIIISRPFLGTEKEVKEAISCATKYDGTYATEQGVIISRYLLSLPFVEKVLFRVSGIFNVKVYAAFDLRNETVAEMVKANIKKCAEKAAGESLTIVDDLLAPNLYE